MFYVWAFSIGAALLAISQLFVLVRITGVRRAGLYPRKGKATMDDVHRLLQSGHKVWAIRCYREIHPVSIVEAKREVDALQLNV